MNFNSSNMQKIVSLIEKSIEKEILTKPELKDYLKNIKSKPIDVASNVPAVLLIMMPIELLRILRIHYSEFFKRSQEAFPNKIILTMRLAEIESRRTNLAPVSSREVLVNDILFPVPVMGRSLEVTSIDKFTQCIYIKETQNVWNSSSIQSVQAALYSVLGENFVIRNFSS